MFGGLFDELMRSLELLLEPFESLADMFRDSYDFLSSDTFVLPKKKYNNDKQSRMLVENMFKIQHRQHNHRVFINKRKAIPFQRRIF